LRSHLNNDEIERLLLSALDLGDDQQANKKAVQSDAFDHFKGCDSCQMMVRAHREAADAMARLKSSSIGLRGSDCPSESVWLDLAAGVSIKNSEICLNHAAQCEHCGPLLREAAADLSEELSIEEAKRMEQLRSATPEWQREFAQRLSLTAQTSGAEVDLYPASFRSCWGTRRRCGSCILVDLRFFNVQIRKSIISSGIH